ncbi:MAG: hypothetical protein WCT10_01070 [Patescibacteria group bacterium]
MTAKGKTPFRRRGFGQSMIEAIIASGIIATAVSSSLTLVSASVSAEKESESGIIAANLAREGIEIARMVRDSNWLAGEEWSLGLAGAAADRTAIPAFSPADRRWSLDYGAVVAIEDDAAQVYRYVSNSAEPAATVGLYVQAAEQPAGTVVSPFRRLVTTDVLCDVAGMVTILESGVVCAGEEIGVRVRSRVQWLSSSRPRRLEIVEQMYNWR